MSFLRKFKLLPLLLAVGFAAGAVHAADEPLAQARALMQGGKPGAAYELLEKLEFERAGDPDFDYALGIAALDSGKPDLATLAFERVLAVNPNSAGARLDMARAYFALGDFVRARKELSHLSALNPPPAAKAVIEKYLAEIDEREKDKRTTVSGYVEGFGGYDSNITSVVGDFTSAVLSSYNLAGFQPTGSSLLRSSGILGTGAGVDINHQLDERLSLYAGADARHRGVLDANNYTSEQLDARAGLALTMEQDIYRVGVTLQNFSQRTDTPGISANRNSVGLNGEWRHLVSQNDQLGVFGAATQQRFPDIPTNDIDSLVVGGSWLHLFAGDYKPLLVASLYTGQDDAQRKLITGADNGKRYWGGRVVGQVSLAEDIDLFAGLGYLKRDDTSKNARSTLVADGQDRISDLSLGLNWRPAKDWTLRPVVSHGENRSNVAISAYTRTEASVTVRYDFH